MEENKIRDPGEEPSPNPPAGPDPKAEAPGNLPPGSPAEAKAPGGEAEKGRPAKKKKRAVLFLALLFGLLILLVLLNALDFDAIAEKFRSEASDLPAQTAKTYPEEWFEIPDYNEDVTADPVYMDQNRYLSYKFGDETFLISGDPADHGALCVFWQKYMDALIAGDAKALKALHVDGFVEKLRKQGEFVQGYEKGFTPQKIYNFSVSLQSMQDLKDGDAKGNYKGYVVYYFVVSYRIKDNNGTFRRDFYDDEHESTVPLLFEVLEKGDEIRINGYSRMRTLTIEKNEEEGINFMMYIWIGLILMAIVSEALTTSLVAVWFIPSGILSLVLSIVLPDQIVVQIVAYTAMSLLLLLLTRPLVKRRLQKGNYQPTNADMVIGKTAVVTERIDNIAQTGEVSVNGKRWSARSADGTAIEKDQLVSVLEIQGVKLICEMKR